MIGLKLKEKTGLKKSGLFFIWFWVQLLVLNAQPAFTPAEVRFHGLRRTQEEIVFRELTFKVGNPLLPEDTADFFKKSCLNIFNTKLFNYCHYSVDSVSTDSCGRKTGRVHFWLSERWYTFPFPIFELADRNFNEWWYDRNADLRRVNYGIRLIQKNVRGRNEDLIFTIQGGFTRRLDLAYVFPYVNKKQTLGLKIQGSYSNNKDVAYRSENNRLVFQRDENSFGRERYSGGFQFTLRKSIYAYHYLDFSYFFNRVSDLIYGLNPGYFLGPDFQRYGDIRYGFLEDRRDFRYFAQKGFAFQILAQKAGLFQTDNFEIWSIRASYSRYWKLGSSFFFASRLDGETSYPSKQAYLGTRVLGFENRFVRGYERYVVEGRTNTHIRNSLRYRFFSRKFSAPWMPLKQFQFIPTDIYLTALGDGGYVDNPLAFPENRRLSNTLLIGYGLGLNIVTFYDIVLRFEYSFNKHGDKGLYFAITTDI